MKNKVIRGVLAAACVTTAVSAANVFGAGTEQSLVNEASAVTQEETEETSEAETIDENTPEMTETETPDSTAEKCRLGSSGGRSTERKARRDGGIRAGWKLLPMGE